MSLFCNVRKDCVINAVDVASIYELPLVLHRQGLDQRIVEHLNIWTGAPNLKVWEQIIEIEKKPKNGAVAIAMVGKYVDLTESYKSLSEALHHSGFPNECRVEIVYVDSEQIEKSGFEAALKSAAPDKEIDALLVPGGFGSRGSEGKIAAVRYAREKKLPFFGICLGLQMAVIEYARHVAGLKTATSREFDEKSNCAVIDLMDSQRGVTAKGATMRLGAYACDLKKGSLARKVYGKNEISERHRHRFEVNNTYREQLEKAGLICSGINTELNLVEIIELADHPWFIGVQFHPEFKSSPRTSHPLFSSFIAAALQYRDARNPQLFKNSEPNGKSGSGTTKKREAAKAPGFEAQQLEI